MPTLPRRGWMSRVMLQLAFLVAALPALAGKVAILDGKIPAIGVGGRIEVGDERVFHDLAGTMPNPIVVLLGPGGSVAAALAIGQEVRARGLRTLVPAGASCASACALIWLAGTTRMLGMDARIGFHAISASRGGGPSTETHAFESVLRHYLLGLGYAGDATATIVNTPSKGLRWLDRIELDSNGFTSQIYP